MKDKKFVIDKFPTHVARTNNKIKSNKMWKINNNGIYSGSLHKHARAIAMSNMHHFYMEKFKELEIKKFKPESYPVQLVIKIYTVINHGSISWSAKSNSVVWKYPSDHYVPTWDFDNLLTIHVKAIQDSLSMIKFWPDDNVSFVRGINGSVEFVDDIEDRRIEISFKKLEDDK